MSKLTIRTLKADGSWTEQELEMSEEFDREQEEYRKELQRLEDAGTPYWCIHEGRDVTHPMAMWKDDGYIRPDGVKMQYKHGVVCVECWGYIQEG